MDKVNLLLVEDDRAAAYQLGELLEDMEKFNVSRAIDGEEALKKLKEQFFPIILTDLMMPKMDGFQLIEEAKNSSEVKKVENIEQIFVVVSSLEEKKDIRRAISLGAYDVMPKPVDSELFKAKMKNYYGLYQLMQQAETRYRNLKKQNSELVKLITQMQSIEKRIEVRD